MSRSIHDEEHYQEPTADEAIGAMKKKTMTMLIVAVVVVGAIAGVIVLFTVDEGGVQSLELTGPSRSDDLLTFAYTIHTDRAAATGPVDLTIKQNGTLVHSRTFPANNGGGRIDVHLADFVIGNGEYVFELKYKDKATTSRYTIGIPDQTNVIITEMGVLPPEPGLEEGSPVNPIYVGDGHEGAIAFTVYFFSDRPGHVQTVAPPGVMLEMRLLKAGVPVIGVDPLNVSVEGKSWYQHNFTRPPGATPGNYTIAATLTNQWVKADSPIKTLTMSNTTFIQNKPYACVKNAPYHGNAAGGYTITADASCSTDDIKIVIYTWLFGDDPNAKPVTNGDNPTESHTYPASTITRSYTGTVCVDDGMSPLPEQCVNFDVTISQN